VEPTVKFYLELEAAKVPTEMHIYGAGGHGFALRPTKTPLPVMSWADRFKEWLASQNISK
jgi:dipeptidyl aminopeptidase/acylaminoacyl peptidase